jgi:uncharacterized repeat protein (TIGR02543 family)
MPDKNVSFTGNWTAKPVGVSFLLNDGTENASIAGNTANANKKFADKLNAFLPPIRTGYTFTGWHKDAAGTGSAWNFANEKIATEGPLTLYAKWELNTYTVRFIDHDGRILSAQNVEHGSNATAPNAPTRSGYNFTGWDKAFENVTGNLDVYARYSAVSAPAPAPTPTPPPAQTQTQTETTAEPAITPAAVANPAQENETTVTPNQDPVDLIEEPESTGPRVVDQSKLAEISTEQGIPTLGIGDSGVPLFGPEGYGCWALADLLFAAAGLILLLLAIPRALLRRRSGDLRIRIGFAIGAVALAVISATAFLGTQDLSMPMVMLDNWSILSTITLGAEIACIRLALPKVKMPVDMI